MANRVNKQKRGRAGGKSPFKGEQARPVGYEKPENVKKKVLKERPFVAAGSKEEQLLLHNLSRDITNANKDFVGFVAKNASLKKKEVKKETDMFTKMYYQRCLMKMAEPLRQGVSVDSVVQTAGMYVGMALFSKDFRDSVSGIAKDAVYSFVEQKAVKEGPGSKWWDRRNKMFEKEHGRLPLDPQSAAVTQIGFCKGAYEQMRQPGADVDNIMESYKQAVEALHEQAREDGVEIEDIKTSMRTIVGQFMEQDPSAKCIFDELGYGNVKRSDYRIHETEDGRKELRWSGEFETVNGEAFAGDFTPRRPAGKDSFMSSFSRSLDTIMEKCGTFDELKTAYYSKEFTREQDCVVTMMHDDGFSNGDIEKSFRSVFEDRFAAWSDVHPDAVREEVARRAKEKSGKQARERYYPDVETGASTGGQYQLM